VQNPKRQEVMDSDKDVLFLGSTCFDLWWRKEKTVTQNQCKDHPG